MPAFWSGYGVHSHLLPSRRSPHVGNTKWGSQARFLSHMCPWWTCTALGPNSATWLSPTFGSPFAASAQRLPKPVITIVFAERRESHCRGSPLGLRQIGLNKIVGCGNYGIWIPWGGSPSMRAMVNNTRLMCWHMDSDIILAGSPLCPIKVWADGEVLGQSQARIVCQKVSFRPGLFACAWSSTCLDNFRLLVNDFWSLFLDTIGRDFPIVNTSPKFRCPTALPLLPLLEVFELGFENISTRSPPCHSSAKTLRITQLLNMVSLEIALNPKKRTQRRRTKMDVVPFIGSLSFSLSPPQKLGFWVCKSWASDFVLIHKQRQMVVPAPTPPTARPCLQSGRASVAPGASLERRPRTFFFWG